uniref:Uncharacterized protein n=1 Tax=Triticum urartu TaxID=4572 RepID=A0A8R7QVV2_TRIUA
MNHPQQGHLVQRAATDGVLVLNHVLEASSCGHRRRCRSRLLVIDYVSLHRRSFVGPISVAFAGAAGCRERMAGAVVLALDEAHEEAAAAHAARADVVVRPHDAHLADDEPPVLGACPAQTATARQRRDRRRQAAPSGLP